MSVPQAPTVQHPPEPPAEQHWGHFSRAAATAPGQGILSKAMAFLLEAVEGKADFRAEMGMSPCEVRQIHEN